MIHTLEIKNFKSIKQLGLETKRINVFIGEPNTGKSNILEAVGLFSYGAYYSGSELKAFVRFERISNLFHDENLQENIEVKCDDTTLNIRFENSRFSGDWSVEARGRIAHLDGDYQSIRLSQLDVTEQQLVPFKFYRFAVKERFDRRESAFLLPPSGDNLMALLLANKEIRATANSFFSHFGLRLGLRPQEGKIEVIKQLEDIIVSYPYSLASDTLQRMVFYLSAVQSNQGSILAFEEPESHAFPYYTKHLAETIALDGKNNQFFISTHNPYFLLPLLEKSPTEEVAVFITYFADYQTKVKPMSAKEIEEITEIDIFANLDRFLPTR